MNRKSYLLIALLILLPLIFSCGEEENEEMPQQSVFTLDFSLTNPPLGATDLHPGFSFQWTKSSEAVSYELHIGETFDATDDVHSDITETSFTIDDLRYGKTYYWNVVGINSAGDEVKTPTFSFETKTNHFVLDESFMIPQLSRSTSLHIYLPPDYNIGLKTYPVIYMFDGQHLFHQFNDAIPEWSIDETLDIIYQETGRSVIIVGIGNHFTHDGQRCDEYSPWVSDSQVEGQCRGASGQLGGEGGDYMKFIVETLKPFIDSKYRTIRNKSETSIIGAHLGGVMALYAVLEYPDVFGKIGVFSPAFWFVEDHIFDYVDDKVSELSDNNIFFVYGTSQSEFDLVGKLQMIEEIFDNHGFINFQKSGYAGGNCDLIYRFCGREWGEGFKDAYDWFYSE